MKKHFRNIIIFVLSTIATIVPTTTLSAQELNAIVEINTSRMFLH
ncbi:MAG: hypothetical protein ACI4TR_02355 [Bacteroidaceae bacterium]